MPTPSHEPDAAPAATAGAALRKLRATLQSAARAASWTQGNAVDLLPFGAALFPALKTAWQQARAAIWLETYIFHDDAVGLELAATLVDAARRGVQVRVLVDGFGSTRSIAALAARFAGSGVEFMVYRPWQHWFDVVQRGHWRRLHRKLCVVDGELAFIGGINLIDDRFDIHHGWSAEPRLDYAVRVRGPVALQVLAGMRRLWLRTVAMGSVQRQLSHAPGPDLLRSRRERSRYAAEWLAARQPLPAGPGGAGNWAVFVVRDNLLHRRAIERAYIQAIDRAARSVLLVSPYFYPGQAFRDSLKRAAARGVAVTLLLQGRADYRAAAWAAHALYREMLEAGVRIFEYQRAFLHGKVAVVDESWATVGSSNIDPLSLLVNREANLMLRDAGFARQLAAHLRGQLRDALPVEATRLRAHVAWWTRPLVALGARLLIALAGGTRKY
jgi:cardiolipin synthase